MRLQVRLWSIPEQRVVDDVAVHEAVTALTFSTDGARAVIGTLRGKCRFFQVAGGRLEYAAQMGASNATLVWHLAECCPDRES